MADFAEKTRTHHIGCLEEHLDWKFLQKKNCDVSEISIRPETQQNVPLMERHTIPTREFR
jgi:hypothetical protein